MSSIAMNMPSNGAFPGQDLLKRIQKLKLPNADQIQHGLDKAAFLLRQSSEALIEEIKRRGIKSFLLTTTFNAVSAAGWKYAAMYAIGSSAPAILGVAATAMVARAGVELTKFAGRRLFSKMKSYLYGTTSEHALSTSQELKNILSCSTFGLSDAVGFLSKNWSNKSLSWGGLFKGAVKAIGASGATSFASVGAGFGLSGAFGGFVTTAHAGTPEEVNAMIDQVRSQPLNEKAQAVLARIEEDPTNAQAYKDMGHELFNGPHADRELAFEFFSHAADEGNTQALRDLEYVAREVGINLDETIVEEVDVVEAATDEAATDIDIVEAKVTTVSFVTLASTEIMSALEGQEISASVQHFVELAESGNAGAMKEMGHRFLHGDGVERDIHMGIRLFEEAAAAGNTAAERDIGYIRSLPEYEDAMAMNTVVLTEASEIVYQDTEEQIEVISDNNLSFELSNSEAIFTFSDSGIPFYVGETTYSVEPGDGMIRVFMNNYDTSGMTEEEIWNYADALSHYNGMSGAEGENLEIGDPIRVPDIRLLNVEDGPTQNWSSNILTSTNAAERYFGGSQCVYEITRNTVISTPECIREGDILQVHTVDLLKPNLN